MKFKICWKDICVIMNVYYKLFDVTHVTIINTLHTYFLIYNFVSSIRRNQNLVCLGNVWKWLSKMLDSFKKSLYRIGQGTIQLRLDVDFFPSFFIINNLNVKLEIRKRFLFYFS